MQITERDSGNATVLTLSGRLVLGDGEQDFRAHIDALIARGRTRVVINLKDVTYVDSSGIGTLVAKYTTLRRLGGDLKIVSPSLRCERVLAITHLLPLFASYESDDAAVRTFSGDRPLVPGSRETVTAV